MRDHVRRHDVHRWSNDFLTDLSAMSGATASTGTRFSSTTELKSVVERIRSAEHVTLFLDYDGTLVPFAPVPDLAAPDQQLIGLLQHLCARPGISVHIVSGRGYPSLGRWLDRIPATLHAEHGLWSHSPGDSEWHLNAAISDDWKPKVLPILERFVKCTPGSRIEEKSAGIVWHYRQAEPVFGALQAKELRLLLVELLSNLPVQVIAGEKVVEVRTQGIHKGGIVARVLHASGNGNLVVAIGDDRTDEDMFAALPEDGIAIHAGSQPSRARIRVPGPYAVRSLLSSLEP
jgi:trehalose 6-phosphate synthase/phosphatase